MGPLELCHLSVVGVVVVLFVVVIVIVIAIVTVIVVVIVVVALDDDDNDDLTAVRCYRWLWSPVIFYWPSTAKS